TVVIRSMTAATRHRVQRALLNPKERGPRRKAASTRFNFLESSLAFRPEPRRRCPRRGAPSPLCHSQYQLWTHWRLTPSERATADCPSPAAKSCTALVRRTL